MCGKKQVAQKRKRRKRAKGTGTITEVKGLAVPFRARLPEIEIDGKTTQPLLGFFSSYEEADRALFEAIGRGKLDKANMTLGDLWKQFSSSEYFAALSKPGQTSHRAAWSHLNAVEDIKVRDIATDTFQSVVRGMTYKKKVTVPDAGGGEDRREVVEVTHKRASKLKVRNLASLLCKEAMGLGIMLVNFGALVKLPKDDTEETLSFPPSVLNLLWEHRSDEAARIILIWTFTGMRPSELFLLDVGDIHLGPPDYCIGGIKTEAGKGRIIPIPPIIKPFFETALDGRTSGALFAGKRGARYDLNKWREFTFKPYMEKLGITDAYTPNSGRHTYFTMNRQRKVSAEIMMEIMGHEDYATGMENYNHWTEEDISNIYNAMIDLTLPA